MLKQDYIDAQKIMNQAKDDLESILDKAIPQNGEEREAHNALLQLIDKLKSMDAYYSHLQTTKIEGGSDNEKLFVNLIKRNKENQNQH